MVGTHHLKLHLTRGTDAPNHARRAVRAHAGLSVARPGDLDLLVSEAVTNAVRYGGEDGIDLEARILDDGVRVVVRDGGRLVPAVRRPGLHGGYGLNIVARVAAAWGTGPGELWFELR